MNTERITVFKYLWDTLYKKYGDVIIQYYSNEKAKQILFFVLNFVAAGVLLHDSFPNIPILFMISFAVAVISRIVPKLALGIALCIFSGYVFILRPDYGFIEMTLGFLLLTIDVQGRNDEWLFITLITPILVQLNAPYLPIFLAIVLIREAWANSSFVAILQVAFLATFMGNYPWMKSGVALNGPFQNVVHNYSASLSHQFNTMYTYDSGGLGRYLGENLFFILVFVIALKVITTFVGRISFGDSEATDRKRKEMMGLAAGSALCLILAVALAYVCSSHYHILFGLRSVITSFVPVFAVSLMTGSMVKINTYSELTKTDKAFSWESIAGYEDVKDEIREAVFPYTDEATYKRIEEMNLSIVKGILFYGPTGVGKTLFAQVMASEAKLNFIPVKCTDFISKWVGESEAQLKSIFNQARSQTPCIIFFDEIEAFLSTRESDSNSNMQTLVTTFLAEMDGFEKLKDVLVVGATNYPNKIDSAVIRPGRFDKIIYIPHPDEDARKKIFELYLNEKPITGKIDFAGLAKNSERYTPADICAIITEAYRASNYTAVSNNDLLNLLKHNKATMTYKMLETYNEFAARFGRRKFLENESDEKATRKMRWNQVAGMDEAKSELRRYIEFPMKNPDVYKQLKIRQSKGILLFGPPGCGKTHLVQVLADECNVTFIPVKCTEILRAYTGQSESNIRDIFRKAKENRPALIFFDELDAFAEKRGSGDTKIVEQLLMELDNTDEMKDVFVLGATNRIEVIDEALLRPGRFDKLIDIGLPDQSARRILLDLFLEGRPCEIDAEEAARLTEGYTGAEIDYIVNRAAILAAEDWINGDARHIQMADLISAIHSTPRSVTNAVIEEFRSTSRMAR